MKNGEKMETVEYFAINIFILENSIDAKQAGSS